MKYRVRVKNRKYLWGARKVANDLITDAVVLLSVRVDDGGGIVRLGSIANQANGEEDICTLEPGEAITIPLNNRCGVFAASASGEHSYLDCEILSTP